MFTQDDTLSFPKLKQVNLESGRVYVVESGTDVGEVLPSITRVLGFKEKPHLEAWKKRVGAEQATRISSLATTRGSELHRLCEIYLSNRELPKVWPHVGELWHRLKPWLDQHVTRVYGQEQDLCSFALGVAGRTDLICDVDGVFSIVDFKQANKPKSEKYIGDYFLQGSFYACAVYEHTHQLPKQIVFPVTSPEELQLFVSNPNRHLGELQTRIGEFYAAYDKKPVDNLVPAVV